jgi:hypothetical protein
MRTTPARRIQVGQLWTKVDSNEVFLVTRLYDQALTTFAVLRRTGAENEGMIKVKVERTSAGQSLPGFSMAHEVDEA